MKVEVERVHTVNLRNLLGYELSASIIAEHGNYVSRSTCVWLGRADGVEACAIGLLLPTVFAEEPYLWMISTKICEQHPLIFMRWSRRVMDEILDLYPSVIGLCDCHNLPGQRWLRWLGARFDDVPTANNHFGFRIMRWPQQ